MRLIVFLLSNLHHSSRRIKHLETLTREVYHVLLWIKRVVSYGHCMQGRAVAVEDPHAMGPCGDTEGWTPKAAGCGAWS